MNRETELDLLRRCYGLAAERTREMTDADTVSPLERYTSEEQFEKEVETFKRLPQIVAHSGELSEPGSYIALDWIGNFPLLITRDEEGEVHAFANACQHRGSRLKKSGSGCEKRFMCPYHAWTYDLKGQLKTIPHKSGFPSVVPENIKLKELHATEYNGFIWVQMLGDKIDVEQYLGGLGEDLLWFGSDTHVLFHEENQVWDANWKVVIEGGIESYHFKIAHKDTIAPLFNDTLSVFDEFGPHLRSVLTKTELKKLKEMPEEDWDIRVCANVLYSFYPMSSILVQPDHFAMILSVPISKNKTQISIRTYVPADAVGTEKAKAHWQANFDFTKKTLLEDFELAEEIQQSMDSGASSPFRFGRFEQALERFHAINEEWVEKA